MMRFVRIEMFDTIDQGQLRKAEAGSDAGTDLGGIAVDRLLAAEHQTDLIHVRMQLG